MTRKGQCVLVATSVFVACGGSANVGSVSGTVSGPNGAAVLGAAVAILGTDHLAITDPAGKFHIDGIKPGTYIAQAGASGFQLVRLDGVVVTAGSNNSIAVSLAPTPSPVPGTGSVVGVVKLSDVADYTGTLVSLAGTNFSAVTAGSGNFLLAGVLPGQYMLLAQRSGYGQVTVPAVQVTADSKLDVGVVTLSPTPGGGGY